MRRVAVLLLLLVVARCFGSPNNGIIQLTSFPTAAVADGRTIVTIEADVRDSNGRPVPDGTPVMMSTDLGSFQNPLVTTQNGVAHAKLVASSLAGMAKINASVLLYGATATLDYSFVSDASMLSKAKEYIEVDGDKIATYSYDQKLIQASGMKKNEYLRYRDIEVRADVIELKVDSYEVLAKNGVLKIGKGERKFGNLYFILNQREGYATTTFKRKQEAVAPNGRFMKFVQTDQEQDTYGVAHLKGVDATAPGTIIDPGIFRIDQLATSTTITAKKITAFPKKKLLFESAQIFMGTSRVMRVPFYEVDLVGSQQLFSDNIFNINNSQLSLDYPYYLTLKPGITQLLSLQTGATNSSGTVSDRGLFLDYDYKWDKGDAMQGGIGVQGIGRGDWGLTGNQSWHFNNGGSLSTMLELPSHNSYYGSLSASQPLRGYQASVDASVGNTLTGTPFSSENYTATLEKNPFRISNIPANFYAGLEAYTDDSQSVGWFSDPSNELAPLLQQKVADSQTAVGPRLRAQSNEFNVGSHTTLDASFSLAKLYGHNTLDGLTYNGLLTLNTSFAKNVTTLLSYAYTEDGLDSSLLGRQQLSLQSSFRPGKFRFDFLGIQGLDADRNSYQVQASYQFTRLWRFGYAYQQDRYFGANYSDFDFVLGYRIGYKEFGLVFDQKLRRLGFQLLGTTIN